MVRNRYSGYVTSIRASQDVDVITVRFGEIGGQQNSEMKMQLEHEPGNGSLYRMPVLVDVSIDTKGE